MTYMKLEGTGIHVRPIKYSWVKPLIFGEEKVDGKVMMNLFMKVACDSKGGDVIEDDLFLDDISAIKRHILGKIKEMSKKN